MLRVDKALVQKVVEFVNNNVGMGEVLSRYNQTRKSGPRECFFHEDKNPSMLIDVDRGMYNCFSCGRKGKTVGLWYELENKDTNLHYYEFIAHLLQGDYGLGKNIKEATGVRSIYVEDGVLRQKELLEVGEEKKKKFKPTYTKTNFIINKDIDEMIEEFYLIQMGGEIK